MLVLALALGGPLALSAAAADSPVSEPSLQWDGASALEQSGSALAEAGDVNADGLADALVAAPLADPSARADAGSVYVVFGRRSPGAGGTLGSGGIRIDGALAGERLGTAVAGAGDVNGDGLGDVIVTTREADYNGRSNSGSAYVVFGRGEAATVDLANLGSGGFRIDAAAANDRLGTSAAGVGDQNGDGLADVAVGAAGADPNARSGSGSIHIVFGKAGAARVDLAALGTGGYRVNGGASGDALAAVTRLDDLTNDGRPELLVGAPSADPSGRPDAGSAYVVAGRGATTPVELTGSSSWLRRVDGGTAYDALGGTLAHAGDPNGDARPELMLGATGADPHGRSSAGSVYVVPADPGPTIDLAAGVPGWRIDGPGAGDALGSALSGGRDVNSDGVHDIVVGNSRDDRNGRGNSGSGYLLYGGARQGVTDLAATLAAGFRVDGAAGDDRTGTAAALSADLSGDGRADVLLGAPRADRGGRADAGTTLVLHGFGQGQVEYPKVIQGTVTRPLEPVGPSSLVRTGSVHFSVSPPLPAGLTLDPHTGAVSGTPSAFGEDSEHVLTLTDVSGAVQTRFTVRVEPLPDACANRRVGTDGADRIAGSRGGDEIHAGAGDDEIDGGAADDCLLGEADEDTLQGGSGADTLTGGGAADRLGGGEGDDDVDGGDHPDQLHGGAGADVLRGAADADQLHGGDDRDELFGGDAQDLLQGEGAGDRLSGNAGEDRLFGGEGDDWLDGGSESDRLDGGNGHDRVFGGDQHDILRGGAGEDLLYASVGNDRIHGDAGRDIIDAGSGNDVIVDASGRTQVHAGSGNDRIHVRNGQRDVVNCGGGRDTVRADKKDKLHGCERSKRG